MATTTTNSTAQASNLSQQAGELFTALRDTERDINRLRSEFGALTRWSREGAINTAHIFKAIRMRVMDIAEVDLEDEERIVFEDLTRIEEEVCQLTALGELAERFNQFAKEHEEIKARTDLTIDKAIALIEAIG